MPNWAPIATVYDPLKAGSIDGTDTIPHDRAIERAMKAEYYPNKNAQKGDPRKTIFVGRLNHFTTPDDLDKFFSHYGRICRIRLIKDLVTGFSKGYAFVEYEERHSAVDAYNRANGQILNDFEMVVDFECSRTLQGWIPRRLGGGFGGQRESGQLRFGGRICHFRAPILLKNDRKPKFREPSPSSSHHSSRHRRDDGNTEHRSHHRTHSEKSDHHRSRRDEHRSSSSYKHHSSSTHKDRVRESSSPLSSRKHSKRSHRSRSPSFEKEHHSRHSKKSKKSKHSRD